MIEIYRTEMNYKDFNLGDWIGYISGVIEDETTLEENEMRDLVEFLTTMREPKTDVLDRIRAEIIEEKECAYADFDKYKVDYLGVDSRYVEDELPYDDFRYGMERVIEIIDKYRQEG